MYIPGSMRSLHFAKRGSVKERKYGWKAERCVFKKIN